MKKGCLIGFILLSVLATFLFIAINVVLRVGSIDIDPPDTSDLVPDRVEVDDEENAYTYLNKASVALDWPEDDEYVDEILEGKKSDRRYVADLLRRNQKALAHLDEGLKCHICQGPILQQVAELHECIMDGRTFGKLLLLKIMQERERGQWANAVITCGKLLQLGNLIQNSGGCVVNNLVGIAVLNQGCGAARDLAVTPEMPKEELALLSDALNHVGPLDQGFAQAMKAEFQIAANMVTLLAEGKLDDPDEDFSSVKVGYSFQPNKTKQLLAEYFRDYLQNGILPPSERDFVTEDIETQIIAESKQRYLPRPNIVGKMFIAVVTPICGTLMTAQCRCNASLAATRLLVACRCYEMDHGQLPAKLEDLVPDYLAAVPIDPFDGQPFRYVREKGIVYSVGTDLRDSGGSEVMPDGEPFDSEEDECWDAEDAVFYIHGWPEESKPAEESEPVGE